MAGPIGAAEEVAPTIAEGALWTEEEDLWTGEEVLWTEEEDLWTGEGATWTGGVVTMIVTGVNTIVGAEGMAASIRKTFPFLTVFFLQFACCLGPVTLRFHKLLRDYTYPQLASLINYPFPSSRGVFD